MKNTSLEEGDFEDEPEDSLDSDSSQERPKRGRPARKMYWRKIEDYWERRRLQQELEDIFFQNTDSETLV